MPVQAVEAGAVVTLTVRPQVMAEGQHFMVKVLVALLDQTMLA
jgi:hypothetical protein